MRLHITLDDELLRAVDELAGPRARSGFIRDAVAREVELRRASAAFDRALGAAPEFGSDLPDDWIPSERRSSTADRERTLAASARHDRPD